MTKIIVSIISEQTIPNYIFIKEMFQVGDELMFISSKKMENKISWITNTLQYKQCRITPIVFENKDDEEKWDKMEKVITQHLNKNVQYAVNLTGGTKYMALAVQSIFEKFNSTFYYIPFPKNHILMLSSRETFPIKYRVNVEEYMSLYNLNISAKAITQSKSYTEDFFKLFTTNKFSQIEYEVIDKLRPYRDKNINIREIEVQQDTERKPQIANLGKFLENFSFPLKQKEMLKKDETQFITGGWFEEYIYHLINEKLKSNDIKIGVLIRSNDTQMHNRNDLDVVFTKGNKLFVIECKTGVGGEGLFNQIVYKASALKEALLGLSAKSYICSLSSEDETAKKTAKYMGTNYCDKTYFTDDAKLNAWIEQLKNESYD